MKILWCRGGGTLFQEAPQPSYYLLKYFPNKHHIFVCNFGCDYFYDGFYRKSKKYWFRRNILVFEPAQLNFFPMNRYYHLNDFFPSFQSLSVGILESFDADIIVGVGFWGGIAGAAIHKVTTIPFVYDYTDPYTREYGSGPFGIYHLIERLLPRMADLTICVSYELADNARSFGARKIEVIPNGFEPDIFLAKKKTQKKTKDVILRIKKDKKVVLYVGQIGRTLGMDIFIKSAAFVPDDVIFILVGSGPGAGEVKSLVNKLGLGKKIRFLGPKPREEIPEFINLSDICVVPYSRESSIKLIEYGALGKPVLTFKGPVERSFLKDKEIVVSEWDPKEFASLIKHLLNDKRKSLSIGKRLQKKVLRDYRWDHLAKRYAKILENVLDSYS